MAIKMGREEEALLGGGEKKKEMTRSFPDCSTSKWEEEGLQIYIKFMVLDILMTKLRFFVLPNSTENSLKLSF